MREIKFRAWDADMGMMIFPKKHYAPKYASGHLSEFYNPEENEFHIAYDEDERFTRLQFTGLKDKNGKEIYDGDILKWRDEPLRVGWGDVGWVLFSEMFSSFGRPKGSNCNEVNTKGYTNTSEIIGDIYTTPELLTNN